jgi:hypothetical protein
MKRYGKKNLGRCSRCMMDYATSEVLTLRERFVLCWRCAEKWWNELLGGGS